MSSINDFDIGDQVVVDPKKGNPPHGFGGVIVDKNYQYQTISVRDQDDDVFEVDLDQVSPMADPC